MELNYTIASCFCFNHLCELRLCIKLHVEMTTLIALQGHMQLVESLVIHGIIDKAAYLSKVTKLHLLFLSLLLVCSCNRSHTTHIILYDDAIHLQTTYRSEVTESVFKPNCN